MTVRVPKTLEHPPLFLFWHADTACIAIGIAVLFLYYRSPITGALLGLFAGWRWHRLTLAHGRTFTRALYFWYLGFVGLKRLPPSAARHFEG